MMSKQVAVVLISNTDANLVLYNSLRAIQRVASVLGMVHVIDYVYI